MLAGATARGQQTFRATSLAGYGFQALTPVDFMGPNAAPAGAPFIAVRHDDDEAHLGAAADGTKDFIDMYSVAVNWNAPSSSVFTTLPKIEIAEFNSWFLDYSTFATVPQPGSSSRLDPIREVILNRANYLNLGTYETIVGDFATNIDTARSGSVVDSGVRWFELRRTPPGSGNWMLYQEGTFGDGGTTKHHLEGSVAMNKAGDIAMGFNVTQTSPSNIYASIKYTGRMSTDPLNVMTQGESDIVLGAAAETSGRWGDYPTMAVDPSDDCTFWITHEYRPSGGWGTRVASFRLLPAAPAAPTFTAAAKTSLTVNWAQAAGAHSYDLYRATGGSCSGAAKVNAAPITGLTYNDTGLTCATQYSYYLVAASPCGTSANGICASVTTSTCSTCTPPGAPTLTSAEASCSAVDLAWAAGTGTTLSYNVYRSTTSGSGYVKLGGMPVTGTVYSDSTAAEGTTYYYVVKGACDSGGTNESGNSNEGSAARQGTPGAPTGVTATTNRCADVRVSWSPVAGATSYKVLRGASCGSAIVTFTGAANPYDDATAVAGTTYQYWVVAVNTCGDGASSGCAAGTRLATPTAPSAPTYTALSCTSLTVNWSAVTGATLYDVYRKAGSCGGGAAAVATNLSGTSFSDSGLADSSQYAYFVVAKNACGSSGQGTCSAVTTTHCAPNIVYQGSGAWAQVAGMGNDDAVVDPGESWDVGVTLTNSGTASATNVAASLAAAGATFCTGTASYGTIAPGASVQGSFRFTVAPSFTCGDALSFNVVSKTSSEGGYADEAGAFARTVGTPGGGSPVNYPQTAGLPLAIPDNNAAGVNSDMVISVAGTITDVNVNLGATHTWVGDLIFTLTHVDTGTSVTFIDRPGYTGSGNGCSRDDIAATLDDAASSPVENECSSTPPAINGTFSPNNPLSAFNGESLAGTWRLNASDRARSDTGSVTSWSLDITTAGAVCHAWTGTHCTAAAPAEVSPGSSYAEALQWSADKAALNWQAPAGTVAGYRMYRGALADLPNLMDAGNDSCTRYEGSQLSVDLSADAPESVPGSFYWYLVSAYNGAGEGPAGDGTASARTINSTGSCP